MGMNPVQQQMAMAQMQNQMQGQMQGQMGGMNKPVNNPYLPKQPQAEDPGRLKLAPGAQITFDGGNNLQALKQYDN